MGVGVSEWVGWVRVQIQFRHKTRSKRRNVLNGIFAKRCSAVYRYSGVGWDVLGCPKSHRIIPWPALVMNKWLRTLNRNCSSVSSSRSPDRAPLRVTCVRFVLNHPGSQFRSHLRCISQCHGAVPFHHQLAPSFWHPGHCKSWVSLLWHTDGPGVGGGVVLNRIVGHTKPRQQFMGGGVARNGGCCIRVPDYLCTNFNYIWSTRARACKRVPQDVYRMCALRA